MEAVLLGSERRQALYRVAAVVRQKCPQPRVIAEVSRLFFEAHGLTAEISVALLVMDGWWQCCDALAPDVLEIRVGDGVPPVSLADDDVVILQQLGDSLDLIGSDFAP
jgi:hypothetical protein